MNRVDGAVNSEWNARIFGYIIDRLVSFPRINIEYLCSEILVLKLRLNSVARTESLLRGDSFIALGREGEMKTRYNQMRRSLLVFAGSF